MFSCEFCEISKNTFLHRSPLVSAFVIMNGLIKDLHSKLPMNEIKKATKHVAATLVLFCFYCIGKVGNHQILPSFAMIKLFCKLKKLIETEIISKDIFEVVFRNSMIDNKQLWSSMRMNRMKHMAMFVSFLILFRYFWKWRHTLVDFG